MTTDAERHPFCAPFAAAITDANVFPIDGLLDTATSAAGFLSFYGQFDAATSDAERHPFRAPLAAAITDANVFPIDGLLDTATSAAGFLSFYGQFDAATTDAAQALGSSAEKGGT